MADLLYSTRRDLERMSRQQLRDHQLVKLNWLLDEILPENRFHAARLQDVKLPLTSLDQLGSLPLTTKADLVAAAVGEVPANTTYPNDTYVRFHRTSGTRGQPLAILDTRSDWQAWIESWQFVLDAAEVSSADRAVMAFSFGPFIGFWSAYDALAYRGAMVIPAGGMSTKARLDLIADTDATVICCTPTYALRMMEVADEHQLDLADNSVRSLIVAGEPGGSLPSVRGKIEAAWSAQVIDHAGATEIGPWGYADANRRGLHVIESDFIAEFLDSETGECQPLGGDGGELEKKESERPLELVLTSLRRTGMPVLRYRTGDLVRPGYDDSATNRFVLLHGGILGRADDMVVIRGVNVFPSSVEEILRGQPNVGEYRIIATTNGEMDELLIEIEDQSRSQLDRLAAEFESRLGLRVQLRNASARSLPRFEAKSSRFVDHRDQRLETS